jgi:uncharacterized Zn finger protein (UPF0148 family)
MLQGYVLKESTCDRCGMPLMEHKGTISCVVCPALAKKAKKQMIAQQQKEKAGIPHIQRQIDSSRMLERGLKEIPPQAVHIEKERHLQSFPKEELEREQSEKRRREVESEEEARLKALERRKKEEQLEADRKEKEERLRKFREAELERERLEKKQKAAEEEKTLLAMEQEEEARLKAFERRMKEEQLEADRKEKEERLRKFREEELKRERQEQRQKAVEEEKARLLAMELEEEARLKLLEEEEARILQGAKERSAENARRERQARLLKDEEARILTVAQEHASEIARREEKARLMQEEARILKEAQDRAAEIGRREKQAQLLEEDAQFLKAAQEHVDENARREEQIRIQSLGKQQEESHRLVTIQLETEAMLAVRHAAEMVKEREMADALLEDKKKVDENTLHLQRAALLAEKLATEKAKQKEEELALLEETRRLEHLETQTLATKGEYMQRDLLEQQRNARLIQKALLDEEVERLEEARVLEELEVRRFAEEQRAEDEARMIAALEADAAAKASAAEDAIRKAKEALEAVNSTKREIIAQTIALAEREAIAETERHLKAEMEDYKERVILPTESQLYRERWETLRMEGRAIMTRRVLQGWELVPETCKGAECEMSPLITKHGRCECVVCGGTGTGEDGVYAVDENEEEQDNKPVDVATIDPELLPENVSMYLSKSAEDGPLSYAPQDDFEQKRDLVSKEIGKRMLMGWTLLDASCPTCVMPLMMDNNGYSGICVLCGPVEAFFDASTIKTKDMDYILDKQETIVVEEEKKEDVATVKSKTTEPSGTPKEHVVQSNFNVMRPSLPPEDPPKPSPPSKNDLLVAIRQRAGTQRLDAVLSDPPAHTKGTSTCMYSLADSDDSDEIGWKEKQDAPITPRAEPEEMKPSELIDDGNEEELEDEPITLTIPKNFDLSDPKALQDLIKAHTRSEDEIHDTIEVTKSGAIYTAKDAMSTDMIAKMFLRSPQGYDFQDVGADMSLEEVKELVDIFMATNFNEPVPDVFKYEVAQEILEKLQPEVDYVVEPAVLFDPQPHPGYTQPPATPTYDLINLEHSVYGQPSFTQSPGVINLEHIGSPFGEEQHPTSYNRAFPFDDYVETRSVKSTRRSKPTPETLMMSRLKPPKPAPGMSPKPPRAGGNSRREGAPVIVPVLYLVTALRDTTANIATDQLVK